LLAPARSITSSRLVSAAPRSPISSDAATTIRSRVALPLAVFGAVTTRQPYGVLDFAVQIIEFDSRV